MPTKLSRRSVIKSMIAGGAFLAAAPYLGKAFGSAAMGKSGQVQAPAANALSGGAAGTDKLVLLVDGSRVVGYRGLEEIRLDDGALASTLQGTFRSRGTV